MNDPQVVHKPHTGSYVCGWVVLHVRQPVCMCVPRYVALHMGTYIHMEEHINVDFSKFYPNEKKFTT